MRHYNFEFLMAYIKMRTDLENVASDGVIYRRDLLETFCAGGEL